VKIVLIIHKYGVPLADPCCFPLGFLGISSVLKQAGHDVKILNYNLWEYDFDHELDDVDAVLFTGFEEFGAANRAFSALCRERGIRTILGGAMATFDTGNQAHYFDAVVVGEGEVAVLKALTEDGVHRMPVPSIDFLPYPDYEGFGIAEYHKRNPIRHIGVLTSRGCPHRCTFCSHALRFRTRYLKGVAQEIDYYTRKYDPQMIVFNDNTLNVTKNRFLAVCDMMKIRSVKWSAAIRVDNFDEECALAAKLSGCSYFVVGVESLQQSRLDKMQKDVSVEQVYKTLDLLHKYEIGYHGNLIVGIDDDTEQDIFMELATDWRKYNLFPVMFQKFIGTCANPSKNISPEFGKSFKQYAESKGKYMYPEVALAS
jgi:radical SAM superfamily enzyme YgiQ (UPF0313 family)